MNKRLVAGIASIGVLMLGLVATTGSQSQTSSLESNQPLYQNSVTEEIKEKPKPSCDGTVVTTNCTLDGSNYSKYILHEAIPEKSHTETVTTYRQQIRDYCTLCSDGTYSPSCATGRGACSHHGGVAEWNAPRYTQVPEYTSKVIVDAPAIEAYYEKILE